MAGSSQAKTIISGALYIISAGSSDFIQNYYINPYLYKFYTPDEFSSILVQIFSNFVKVRNDIILLAVTSLVEFVKA